MDMPFAQAELYLSKLTASHFNTLNTKIANQNVLVGFSSPCSMRTQLFQMRISGYEACTALDGKIPLFALTGITPDISIILLFTFYQPVFSHKTRIFHLKVKRGLATGLDQGTIAEMQ